MTRERFELEGLLQRDDPDLPPPIYSLIVAHGRVRPDRAISDLRPNPGRHSSGPHRNGRRRQDRRVRAGPKTVFVVEHNPKFQEAFREKLKASGYRVLISINASQAVVRFQTDSPTTR